MLQQRAWESTRQRLACNRPRRAKLSAAPRGGRKTLLDLVAQNVPVADHDRGKLPPEPTTRFLLAVAGILVISVAVGLVFTLRHTSSVNETTNSAHAAITKITDTSSSGSDALILGLFATGAVLILIGAFFERINSVSVRVGGANMSADLRPYVTSGGGQLTIPPAQVVGPEGQTTTLHLDPELLFRGTDEVTNATGTSMTRYDLATDYVRNDYVADHKIGSTLNWRNITMASIGANATPKTFDDIGFRVEVKGTSHRALFLPLPPTDAGTARLRGIVFFVPPAAGRLEWSTEYTWGGLWEPLRKEGRDVGRLIVSPHITSCTEIFLFPEGAQDVKLTVDSPSGLVPDVMSSIENGRQVVTWRVPAVTTEEVTYDYTVSARSPNPTPTTPSADGQGRAETGEELPNAETGSGA
jgi:hypothetical protein